MSLTMRLTELISTDVLQNLQDLLADYLKIGILVTDTSGTPVTRPSRTTGFCVMTRQSKEGRRGCAESDKNGGLVAISTGKMKIYRCHAGMIEFAVPLVADGECIGSVVGGQVWRDKVDREGIRAVAVRLGLDPDTYLQAAEAAPVRTEHEVQDAAAFLGMIIQMFVDLGKDRMRTFDESRKIIADTQSQSALIMQLNNQLRQKLQLLTDTETHAVSPQRTLQEMSGGVDLVRQTTDLTGLVEDTLDYLHFREEEAELNETTYEVQHVITNEMRRSIAMRPELEPHIRVEADPGVPFYLLGDPGRIGQLEGRILDYGFRHPGTEEALIRVHCTYHSYATVLHLTFLFEGGSLTEEEREEITDAFSGRGDFVMEKQAYELIGLSVAGKTAAAMSGTIQVLETDDRSFAFRVSIPQLGTKGNEF